MNKRGTILFGIILALAFLGSVSANVNLGNPPYSISKEYSPGQEISGWVNISIANEPVTSVINQGGSTKQISLQDFLNKAGISYQCNPTTCGDTYSLSGSGLSSTTFSLDAGHSRTLGIFIGGSGGSGSVTNIGGISLNVNSTAPEADLPQLSINLMNGSFMTWKAYNGSGSFSGQHIGCYNSANANLIQIPTAPNIYCEEINIPVSPRLLIGAYLNGSTTSKIAMSIYDSSDLSRMGSCNVTMTGSGDMNCTPVVDAGGDFSVSKQGNFYVCLSYPSGSSGDYKINATQSASPSGSCGITANGDPSNVQGYGDFNIFASWEKFAPIGDFILNDTSIQDSGNTGYSSSSKLKSYITDNYNNNCSAGCVIPITFNSNKNQIITLSGLVFPATVSGFPSSNSNLYNVSLRGALLSLSGYKKVSLNGDNFTVNNSVGNHSFDLVFNGNSKYPLISTKYSVLDVPQSVAISPLVVAALNPTTFYATVSTPLGGTANVTSYKWNFGDGSANQTTPVNNISHTYNNIGVFNLTINATNSAGLSVSNTMQISVLPPKEAVNQILMSKMGELKKLKGEIGNVSSAFSREALSGVLNLNQTTAILNNLTAANASAGASGASDEQYVNILQQLFTINLPASVQKTQQANSLQFVPSQNNINLDALKAIGGGSYESSNASDYKDSIISWDVGNIPATIDYSEFSTVTGNFSQKLISIVKINVGANPSGGNAYLIIPKMDGLILDKNYPRSGNYYYVTLGNNPQTVQIATTQSISPVNLPVFIAPSLSQISLSGNGQSTGNDMTKKWLILAGILGGILFVAFIVYIILGKWYQKRYESYLFKNKNDLYNVVNYIHSAKSKGVKNSQIEKSLRRSNWTSEQISYVMKKYAGRGVGLPGFIKRTRNIPKKR